MHSQGTAPFVAWTDTHNWGDSPSGSALRASAAHQLQQSMRSLHPFVGKPAIEGVIVYDDLARGLAVASLLNAEGRSLPPNLQGGFCDGMFDEDALWKATSDHGTVARLNDGARGMLLTLAADPGRRLLLLPQSEAMLFRAQGNEQGTEHIAALGLLAHELGHARDYADGRPGRPTREDIAKSCKPEHGAALYEIADMAIAEYVATKTECAAQQALFGASSYALAQRAASMSRAVLNPITLDEPTPGLNQGSIDRQTLGYHVGTLAAYHRAASPIVEKDGEKFLYSTADMVKRNIPRGSALGALVKNLGPALEAAASAPTATNRQRLAQSLEKSVQNAREVGEKPKRMHQTR